MSNARPVARALLLIPVEKVWLSNGPLVVLVSRAVRAALLVERMVVPLHFLLFVLFTVGCQSLGRDVG